MVAFGREILEAPEKILTRQTGDSIIGAIDRKRLYTGRSLHSWILRRGQRISLELLLSILNSKLMTYLYQAASRERGRALAQVKLNKLKELPFPQFESLDASKKRSCDKIDDLAKRIELLSRDPAWNLKSRPLVGQIDELVYELYGITAVERKIIEESVPG